MNNSIDEENYKLIKNNNKFEITSDAYINNIPEFIQNNPNKYEENIDEVHKILFYTKHNINKNDVYYKKIDNLKYLKNLIILHKEFFPVNYEINYFMKFITNNKIFNNIGAFININNIEYLIGFIFYEICNEEKFIDNVKNIIKKKCCIYYLLNYNNNKFGYIHTLGVINEYRKLYIGSKLINLFLKECINLNCIACYLHCIEYNKSAQKFYEKNNWIKNRIKKKHYLLNEKYYDSHIYYYILNQNYIKQQ